MVRIRGTIFFILPVHKYQRQNIFFDAHMSSEINLSELSAAVPALPGEDDEVTVVVNGEPKVVRRSWLVDTGRAAGSGLAKQILGTTEGLRGSDTIHIESGCDTFDRVLSWLEHGDDAILNDLTRENAPALLEAAEYFCIDRLQGVIDARLRELRADAHSLQREAKMWRDLHSKIQSAALDEDQGSNASPAYASYMYEHRGSFYGVIGPADQAPLTEFLNPAFKEYVCQLEAEIKQWELNFKRFAGLLKSSGNVVYQHAQVTCPGYCTPSLLPYNAGPEPVKLVAGAIGDRVKDNIPMKICGRRGRLAYPLVHSVMHRSWSSDDSSFDNEYRSSQVPLHGKIISITDDRGSEISVQWDDGSISCNLMCGKKGQFQLVYE